VSANGEGRTGPDRSRSAKSCWRSVFNSTCGGRTTEFTAPSTGQCRNQCKRTLQRHLPSEDPGELLPVSRPGPPRPAETPSDVFSASAPATNKAAAARIVLSHSITVLLRILTGAVLPPTPPPPPPANCRRAKLQCRARPRPRGPRWGTLRSDQLRITSTSPLPLRWNVSCATRKDVCWYDGKEPGGRHHPAVQAPAL
jgi:hypothetical protein